MFAKPANTWAWTFWISSVRASRTFSPSRKAGADAGNRHRQEFRKVNSVLVRFLPPFQGLEIF